MNIRIMTEDDIDDVCRIENESFAVPWSRESIEKAYEQPGNIYIIAEEEDEVIGFAGFWTSFDTADLCSIAVKEKYRKRHTGYELLSEGIRLCRQNGIERIMLEVRASNEPAIKLYHKMDFKEIGKRRGYYKEPVEDALIMEKKFTDER